MSTFITLDESVKDTTSIDEKILNNEKLIVIHCQKLEYTLLLIKKYILDQKIIEYYYEVASKAYIETITPLVEETKLLKQLKNK